MTEEQTTTMSQNKPKKLEWTDDLPATVGQQPEASAEQINGIDGPIIDVRRVAPAQRHPLIFDTFADLAPGASFLLINDHDPKPLYYQFAAEHTGEFTWEYLEKGPVNWQVRIGKAQ
jgi:uncharacterized protein (DUF2249 family)